MTFGWSPEAEQQILECGRRTARMEKQSKHSSRPNMITAKADGRHIRGGLFSPHARSLIGCVTAPAALLAATRRASSFVSTGFRKTRPADR
jgi:hypothetical protein